MKRTRKALQYLILDLIATFAVWILFFLMRRMVFEGESIDTMDEKLIRQFGPATVISLYWIFLYSLAGLYSDPYRKSRLREVINIFQYTLFGVLFLFFTIFLDDPIPNHRGYHFYIYYFLLQFLAVSFIHFLISTDTNLRLRKRKIGFPTLIIGCGDTALKLYDELEARKRSLGFKFTGFLSLDRKSVV